MRELAARMPRKAALACVGIVGAILAMGTVWAFQRGGRDFDVFHHAWGLVLAGRGREIYVNSPDRYLYAPGFAWLLAPLGLLPRTLALGLWCTAKTFVVAWMLFAIGIRLPGSDGRDGRAVNLIGRVGVAALGLLLVARPFIVDFGYGQVNVFILGAALWALFEHTLPDRRYGGAPFWSWACLACAAVAKIFPLPLLIIPFVSSRAGEDAQAATRKLNLERAGILVGAAVVFLLPLVTEGPSGLVALIEGWKDALLVKGLPLESHNQSFVAFLHHYFTGAPTHVIAEGIPPVMFGVQAFDSATLTLLSLAWTCTWAGILLAWLLKGPTGDALRWTSVAVGLLIIPSHLVWKTYFVLGLPLATWILARRGSLFFPLVIFALVNLTGYEVIGHDLSGRLEAGSVLLFALLAMVIFGITANEDGAERV